MRYQALLLLVIILLSSYLVRQTSVFSQSGNGINDQQATVIDSLNLSSSPSVIQKNENRIADNASNTQTQTSSDSSVIQQAQSSNQPSTDNSISEQPIIEQSSTTLDQLCTPIQAKIYLAETIEGASVLYEKNSQNRWPIASVSKLMAAIVALENLNQSSILPVTDSIEQDVSGANTLASGESYTVNDLLKAMLSISSNDAAYTLASGLGSDAFVKKMNEKAQELSMSQTTFFEPSGLSYLNQSTAHDVYILLSYVYRNYPIILDITRQKSVTIRDQSSGKRKTLSNINQFAGQNDFFGGKTGYIDQSGGNLVSLFDKSGKMLYVAVFNSPDRFGETQKIVSCLQ